MILEENLEYGKRLIEARKKMGATLEEVSFELKISLKTLKNLEASDSKNLPKPGFTKGFIKAYCKFLKLSPDLVLDEYFQTVKEQVSSKPSDALDSESSTGEFFFLDFLKDQLFPLVLFVVVLAAAFVLYSLIESYGGDETGVGTKSYTEDKMVDVTPVEENKDAILNDKIENQKEVVEIEAVVEEEAERAVEKTEERTEKNVAELEVAPEDKDREQEKDELKEEVVEAKPVYVPPTGKHILVVEPLEPSYLYIQTDKDTRAVRAKLVPEKTRTFQFDQAVIRFKDAGAVNLILDEKELDPVGAFGEEKKIDFPSLKEL